MKKLLILAAIAAAYTCSADSFFGPIIPRNTARAIINQAVKEAKAYTDSKVSTNDTASAEDVASVKGEVASLSNKIETVNDRFANYLTTAGAYEAYQPKGSYLTTADAQANYQPKGEYLTSHQDISGKLDASVAAETYQPKGSYITEHQDLSAILNRLSLLEAMVPDTAAGVTAAGAVTYDDATKDLAVAGELSGSSVIKANSLKASGLSGSASPANGAAIDVTAGAVSLKNSVLAGTTQEHHEFIRVKEAEDMVVEGVTFTGDTYNTIMTGQQTTKFLKSLTIKNCTFDENCKHVNVWFAGFQDNAVLTIKNCTFKTCEQFLCISDFQGAVANTLTVNLENITIANYETGTAASPDVYEGIMLVDDRKCTSEAQLRSVNPFSKVTINIKNVTVKGTKLTQANFVMGSGTPGQMLYYYSKNAGGVYPMNESNSSLFPTVNVVE